jgi:site-specific recombinase XerD
MSSINKCYLTEIKPVDMEAYKASRLSEKLSYSSINTEMRIIKAFFNKAVEWGLILKSPTQNIKFYKIDQKPPPFPFKI